MDHIAVKSKDIAIVGYDRETQTLEVAFRSGGVYQYYDVPESIHDKLLKAESMGRFFNDSIKTQFRYAQKAAKK